MLAALRAGHESRPRKKRRGGRCVGAG